MQGFLRGPLNQLFGMSNYLNFDRILVQSELNYITVTEVRILIIQEETDFFVMF